MPAGGAKPQEAHEKAATRAASDRFDRYVDRLEPTEVPCDGGQCDKHAANCHQEVAKITEHNVSPC